MKRFIPIFLTLFSFFGCFAVVEPSEITPDYRVNGVFLLTTYEAFPYESTNIETRPGTTGSWTTYVSGTNQISNLTQPAYFRLKYLDINDNLVNYSNAVYIDRPDNGKVQNLHFNDVAHGVIRLYYTPHDTLGIAGWQKRPLGGSWSDISGTSGLWEISIEGITETTEYRAFVEGFLDSFATNPGKVTITSEDDLPTATASDYLISPGESTTVTLSLPGYGGTVDKWQKKTGGTWVDIASSGSTSINQTVTEPSFFRSGMYISGSYKYTKSVFVDVLSSLTYGDENHMKSATPITGITSEGSINHSNSITSHIFYDGVGRSVQSVVKEASPGGNDIVSFSAYDEDGRQQKIYQGYTAAPTSGIAPHANPITAQTTFYSGSTPDVAANTRPFTEIDYSDDLSARAESITSGGAAWASKSRTGEVAFNGASDHIRVWDRDGMSNAEYEDGTLIKSMATDEDGNNAIAFTDKNGRKICQMVEHTTGNYLVTYYVYDDHGRLRFIIPPEAMDRAVEVDPEDQTLIKTADTLNTTQSSTTHSYVIKKGVSLTLSPGFSYTASGSSTFSAYYGNGIIRLDDIERFVFEFQYDDKGRVIAKKVPSSGWEYFVYDKLNRPLLSQNAKLRETNQWGFVKYDSRGRPLYSGLYNSTQTRTQLQNSADASAAYYEADSTSQTYGGYTAHAFPKTGLTVHNINYYDDYAFTTATYTNNHFASGQPATNYTRTNHWLTGSKTLILGTTDWLQHVYFYDDEGRIIQEKHSNHLDPANLTDITSILYDDFTGQVQKTKTSTEINSDAYVEQYRYEYDSRKTRLQKIFHTNGTDTEQEMISYDYNELGQVIGKYVHKDGSEYIQETDFTYNEKGWLSMVNDPTDTDDPKKLFAYRLHYNTSPVNLSSDAAYNGRITGIEWSAYYTEKEAYGYQFDKANRLKLADYGAGASNTANANAYNEEVTAYDHNSNIQSLKRQEGSTQVDNLTYNYNGNQLHRVNESGTAGGYTNGANSDGEMDYDEAGNLTANLDKGISSIAYNHLNKPTQIDFSDGRQVLYTYAASGAKLRRVHKEGSTVTEQVDYVANYYVIDDEVAFFSTVEGRVVPTTSGQTEGGEYQYYHRDNLGNIRMIYTAAEPETWELLATMETELASTEETYFFNMSRTINATANTTSAGNGVTTPNEVITLDAQHREGIGTVVEVFPGDQVTMTVNTYYTASGSVSNSAAVLSDLAAAIFSSAGAGFLGEGFSSGSVMPAGYGTGGLANKDPDSNPEAYLNYLFFDRDFNFVSEFTGYGQVTGSGAQDITATTDIFTKPGYLFVYLTYEGTSGYPVSFDDLKVEHHTTRALAYNSYYPFGMKTNQSWVRPENPMNRYLYNAGNERNEVTGYDETYYRLYDPALGRFAGVDILAVADASGGVYNYAGSNPIAYNDPMGDQKAPPPPQCDCLNAGGGGQGGGGWGSGPRNAGDLFWRGSGYGGPYMGSNGIRDKYGRLDTEKATEIALNSGLAETIYKNGSWYIYNPWWQADDSSEPTGAYMNTDTFEGLMFFLNKGGDVYFSDSDQASLQVLQANGGIEQGGNLYSEETINFNFHQNAYLPVEGVGVAGSFNVKGGYRISKNADGTYSVHIGASGDTPASLAGDVTFKGSAHLVVNGVAGKTQSLTIPDVLIYETGTTTIGLTSFTLPHSGNVHLQLDVSYIFRGPEGVAVPMPGLSRSLRIPFHNPGYISPKH